MYIDNQADLKSFVKRALKSPILAIDTEFLREKTYFPKLCLLQMQTQDETAIVDPFCIDDLRVLNPLLESEEVLKLFHAGTQDLEILYAECGVVPHPVFDTQVAATLLGHTQQIGYGALVSSTLGVNLKKADSYTDWSRRPLSQSQLEYAADDVIFLPRVYDKMAQQLEKLGRTKWLDPDFRAMEDPERYTVHPETRFRRLKRVNQLKPRQLSAARELAAWRERRAMKLNIPRKWIMSDEQIVEACRREAQTIDDLFMVRGISDKVSTRVAREMVEALRLGLGKPSTEWPILDYPGKNEANVDVAVDMMSALVKQRARENNIAYHTLANNSDLAEVARGHKDVDVLKGWRREIVGNDLLSLLEGKIKLGLNKGRLLIIRKN